MDNNILLRELFKEVKHFYEEESQFIEYIYVRWIDEAAYEDPQEYKDAILLRTNKYNLKVKNIKYNVRNLSIKITFTDSNKNNVYLELLKTRTKIYM